MSDLLVDECTDMVVDIPNFDKLKQKQEFKKRLIKDQKLLDKRLSDKESLEKRQEKALKAMRYILGLSEKYSTFFKEKVFSQMPKAKPLQERNKFQPTLNDMREVVNIKREKTEEKMYADVSKHLKYLEGGSLRPYQIDGVTWMTVLFENGLNGILADEMGLGKTIQVIALICHLYERHTSGPYLIVAPLSTLPNWESEFKRFAPRIPLTVFHGSQLERVHKYKEIRRNYPVGGTYHFPVVLTSYQTPLTEQDFLANFDWQYIIIDEGHRVKNHECKLSKVLRSFASANRLLLTGTPLQNNITELWALLNFLLPHIFNNVDTFASLLMIENVQDENKLLEQEEKNSLISTIHKVLAPFMLRRLKKDVLHDLVPKKEVTVFCPLSPLQRDLYTNVICKNISKLRGEDEEDDVDKILNQPKKKRKCAKRIKTYYNFNKVDADDDSDFENDLIAEVVTEIEPEEVKKTLPYIVRLTMQNPMMMFKKIVDHPYLIHFPLDLNCKHKQLLVDENLVKSSGKMMVLDAMLPKLKRKGHKVLIFSTLVMTLDFIEEFMLLRGYTYRRLDGSLALDRRSVCITEFNNDPKVFAFLISTRAGGLGLNLIGADTVIFFDRDWNPQVDIQAQDRCHRIGQTRPVVIYTLVTKNTIDEKIILCGHQKRLLEKIVIKDGKFKTLSQDDKHKAENALRDLQQILEKENHSQDGYVFSNRELDKLLDRSDLYEIMKKCKI